MEKDVFDGRFTRKKIDQLLDLMGSSFRKGDAVSASFYAGSLEYQVNHFFHLLRTNTDNTEYLKKIMG